MHNFYKYGMTGRNWSRSRKVIEVSIRNRSLVEGQNEYKEKYRKKQRKGEEKYWKKKRKTDKLKLVKVYQGIELKKGKEKFPQFSATSTITLE